MNDGARTSADGTAVTVDVSRDRQARVRWVVFLGGPVTWITHFMVVYLVVEAGCSGEGRGFEVFDPPVPAAATLVATAVAALVCLAFAGWAYRRWRAGGDPNYPPGPEHDEDPGGAGNFAGILLALFSFVAVLFVGLPALVLEC